MLGDPEPGRFKTLAICYQYGWQHPKVAAVKQESHLAIHNDAHAPAPPSAVPGGLCEFLSTHPHLSTQTFSVPHMDHRT